MSGAGRHTGGKYKLWRTKRYVGIRVGVSLRSRGHSQALYADSVRMETRGKRSSPRNNNDRPCPRHRDGRCWSYPEACQSLAYWVEFTPRTGKLTLAARVRIPPPPYT